MLALIMAGGSGTRFWPASRASCPKQFLRIAGSKSMLQLTFERLEPLVPAERVFVVTAASQAELVREHLPQIPVDNVIIEPFGMNTAPCIALGLARLQKLHPPEECMVVLPADHVIREVGGFLDSLVQAEKVAKTKALVTFGIVPEYPATGYGYIELGNEEIAPHVKKVSRFVEKPAQETAQRYVDGGKHVWNAGIFLFRADQILKALEIFDADLYHKSLESWQNARREDDIVYPEISAFESIKSGAIDTVVMERATNVACAPVDMGWSDVGSWDALYELANKTPEGNALSGDVTAIECENILVHGDNISVATYGVSDLIIVATHKGVIVLPRGQSQSVKTLHDIACRS